MLLPAYRLTALPPVLAQQAMPMAGHDRLDKAMFWTGALFAFTPILVALAVLAVVWYQRRKRQQAEKADRAQESGGGSPQRS